MCPPVRHLLTSNLSRVYQNNPHPVLEVTKTLAFAKPIAPHGNLSLPPWRKRVRVYKIDSSRGAKDRLTPRTKLWILEDQLAGALAQASAVIQRMSSKDDTEQERRSRVPPLSYPHQALRMLDILKT